MLSYNILKQYWHIIVMSEFSADCTVLHTISAVCPCNISAELWHVKRCGLIMVIINTATNLNFINRPTPKLCYKSTLIILLCSTQSCVFLSNLWSVGKKWYQYHGCTTTKSRWITSSMPTSW